MAEQCAFCGLPTQHDSAVPAWLCAFIASDTFAALPEEDRELLVIQENLMDSLSFILARRIRRFPGASA